MIGEKKIEGYLDSWFQKTLDKISRLDTQQMRNLLAFLGTIGFGLFLSWSLLPLAVTKVHDSSSTLEQVKLLLLQLKNSSKKEENQNRKKFRKNNLF